MLSNYAVTVRVRRSSEPQQFALVGFQADEYVYCGRNSGTSRWYVTRGSVLVGWLGQARYASPPVSPPERVAWCACPSFDGSRWWL